MFAQVIVNIHSFSLSWLSGKELHSVPSHLFSFPPDAFSYGHS